jgi:hypothetical protein
MGRNSPDASRFMSCVGYLGLMNASSVSSIKPAVVLTLDFESVLFCNSNVGLKNKIKKALTRIIVTIILNICFIISLYFIVPPLQVLPSHPQA